MKTKAIGLLVLYGVLCPIALISGLAGWRPVLLLAAAAQAAGLAAGFCLLGAAARLWAEREKSAETDRASAERLGDQCRRLARENLIRDIISGGAPDEAGGVGPDDRFLAVLLSFQEGGAPAPSGDGALPEQAYRTAAEAAGALFSEAGIDALVLRVRRVLLCLLPVGDGGDPYGPAEDQSPADVLERLVAALGGRGLEARAYAGRAHPGSKGIKRSYDEAEQTRARCRFTGDERPVALAGGRESGPLPPDDTAEALSLQKQLINCVEMDDFDKARLHLSRLLDMDYFRAPPSPSAARLRLYSLLNTVMDTVVSVGGREDRAFFESVTGLALGLDGACFEAFREGLEAVFDRIAEFAGDGRPESAPAWYTEMMRYIDERFKDPELNVDAVSRKVERSPAYISKTAKKHTGAGLWDYIQRKRVECAKALLASGYSVTECAGASGFSNPRAMTRAFAKFEGTTPGKFMAGARQERLGELFGRSSERTA